MKTLVFDIWGDYGHFRKYFTTSSPLTFSFPPKTSIYGIIGAILGFDKNYYLKHFQNKSCKVAIKIINPIKKSRIPLNYVDTKKAIDMSKIRGRTQVNLELLRDCKYRIYFAHENNEVYNELRDMLISKKCKYTVSLGLSEFLANFEYIGEFKVKEIRNNKEIVDIDTIIPFYDDIQIKIESNREYLRDTVYNEMNEQREITEFLTVLFERTGKSIKCNIPFYYECESGDKIVFL